MQFYNFKNVPYNTSSRAKEEALRDFIKTHSSAGITKITEKIVPINSNNAKIVLKIYWQTCGSVHISKRTISCKEIKGGFAYSTELLNVAKAIEKEEKRNRQHAEIFNSDDLTNWRGR